MGRGDHLLVKRQQVRLRQIVHKAHAIVPGEEVGVWLHVQGPLDVRMLDPLEHRLGTAARVVIQRPPNGARPVEGPALMSACRATRGLPRRPPVTARGEGPGPVVGRVEVVLVPARVVEGVGVVPADLGLRAFPRN